MLKKVLAMMLSLALLLGGAAGAAAEETPAFTMKTFPVYIKTPDNIWREDFPLYFRDGAEDLPFAELNDWAALMNKYKEDEGGYQLTFEDKGEDKARLIRENTFFMEADFAEGKLSFPDFIGFVQPADQDYMSMNYVPEKDNNGQPFLLQRTRKLDLYGDYTVLDLRKYEIPMAL